MQQVAASLYLKPGKERPIQQRHHWIYSGAIATSSSLPKKGELVAIHSSKGERLGLAFFNPGHSIAAHMIAFGEETVEEALQKRIFEAISLRRAVFDPQKTSAFRLIHAEGDGLPGLVVDAYSDLLVMQISHPGIERYKEQIASFLIKEFHPRSLFEKSTSFLRKKGGMEEVRAHLFGDPCCEIEIVENSLRFSVDVLEGQKTGFFLDQRDMRALIREVSRGRRTLNAFAYTGGFSIAALAGGALRVDSVEISPRCQSRLEKNLSLNQFPLDKHRFFQADVFDFLKTAAPWDYDLAILDPPAFVKKREDVPKAFRAYKELNRCVIEKMPPHSLLLTCSCSYHIDEALFQNILFRSALEAGRKMRILSRHRQALDHPISIFHPESSYLKSFLLEISG